MENTSTRSEKLFIGFGIITILSGVYLMIQNQYLIGVPGSIVGVWLVLQNMKQIKDKRSESGL